MPESSSAPASLHRPSFRRRLVLTLGAALAAALTALAALIGLGFYAWLNYTAYRTLDHETAEIASHVTAPTSLDIQRYAWDEPHHRFVGEHVDPYFVQIFDADERLLHRSDNIALLAPTTYPDRLLTVETSKPGLLPRLHTFRAGGDRLYHLTRPLRSADGTLLGYLQVARREPGIQALMQRVAVVLVAGLLLTLAGLTGLVWWQAGRVLRPLAAITCAARAITPDHLARRLTVPADADSETAQLVATLNDQLERLEHAFDEMHRFTANAAHELQTPLTVLRGHVEVALRRPRDASTYRETLQLVGREIDTLSRMVRSLLALARLDREARALPSEPLDLAALARAEAEALRAQAETAGLALHLDLDAPAWTRGQPDLLREVVGNLLDNAIKYTPEGRVELSVQGNDELVLLHVRDTGIGMDEDARAQATDRFYRAPLPAVAEVPGSGLGLALVAQIVDLHGGALRLEETPDGGTRATVELPAAAEVDAAPFVHGGMDV